jgi:2-polyprenyl-3-methyl-5-hydroxy-6-metoxy-1,4-benzoquinol methylase
MTNVSPDVAGALDRRYVVKDDPWSSHGIIKGWLARRDAGAKVLDIGAATGMLGEQFARFGFILHGVEPHPAWAEVARPYYAGLICGTLDQVEDAFLADHDVVVCADVLEHIAQPEQALRRLIGLQPAGCEFFISVPNIANVWVRLNLVLGRFDYTERGILDRTHLRFFTRRTFSAMLRAAGLEIAELRATPIPLNLVHPVFQQTGWGKAIHGLLARLTAAMPTLLGYQFVARAVKRT